MSGLLGEVATPCPPRSKTSRFDQSNGEGSTFDSLWDDDDLDACDDTRNLDFTTEIRAPILTGAKPRRKTTKAPSSFQVHDDGNEGISTRPVNKRKREAGAAMGLSARGRKSSLLAQPAQRFRPKVSFAGPTSKPSHPQVERESRVHNDSLDTDDNKALLMQINGKGEAPRKDGLKKSVRRDTVYIPPDDTTVASAFMGLFSPLKQGAVSGVENRSTENTQINSLEAQIARKRQAKKSLTSSARRAPLQPSASIAQEAAIRVDIAGKNGGKENVPPGGLMVGSKSKSCKDEFPIFEAPSKARRTTDEIQKASTTAKPQSTVASTSSKSASKPLAPRSTNKPTKRVVLGAKQNNAQTPAVDIRRKSDGIAKQRSTPGNKTANSRSSTLSNPLKNSTMSMAKVAGPAVKTKKLRDEYPLLMENISNPAMYEDDWMSHQEVVISQLINGLFDHTESIVESGDPDTLRYELVELYQDGLFTHLHKRVQASLLYGAMSIPKDALARSMRLKQDLGLKRKFLDIWTQTYDLHALRAAAETVVGRRIADPSASQSGLENAVIGEKALKRKLESFLDAFLIQNEDMGHQVEAEIRRADSVSRAYRRTVLRSIMIVVLLDKARLSSGTMLPRCLFAPSSPSKSSAAVLQSLAGLLLPSSGDIIKSLHHIDCQPSYQQHQLQEYQYWIDNLAVDLRDGVRLTRIVELLLYPSASHTNGVQKMWPLSQHLKFPCASRAVKLFNVQIALDSLASTKGADALVKDLRAEDIVDGHREKTIVLLWGLVSKWGLIGLVDWDDVRNEIGRLRRKAVSKFGYDEAKEEDWYNGAGLEEKCGEHIFLLKRWASLLAGLKQLRIENFSTSFADGKIYESIVDEYRGYILGPPNDQNQNRLSESRQPTSLRSRLQALGCSSQFANLVSPSTSSASHIFDSDFTFGALAFLCSRLLSASKRARAVTVLQRAWRRIFSEKELHRRTVAHDVARQCAAVVQTRNRVLWAKTVIVTWWRGVKARRQRRKTGRPVKGAGRFQQTKHRGLR